MDFFLNLKVTKVRPRPQINTLHNPGPHFSWVSRKLRFFSSFQVRVFPGNVFDCQMLNKFETL